jgi:hypothetical protein
MNLHELQPEKFFSAARLVFQEKQKLDRAVSSSSDKPKTEKPDQKDKGQPGEKLEREADRDGENPEKKDEKKKEAPKKVNSIDIRNAVRARAKKLLDDPNLDPKLREEIDTAYKNINLDIALGEKRNVEKANEAAGQLMTILSEANPEDKNLAYWNQEASNDVNTKGGVENQRGVIAERKRVEEYNKSLRKVYDDWNKLLPEWQTYVKDAREGFSTATQNFDDARKTWDKARTDNNAVSSIEFPAGYKESTGKRMVYPDSLDQELNWVRAQLRVYNGGNGYSKEDAADFNNRISILNGWKTKKAELQKAADEAWTEREATLKLKNEWEEYKKKVEGEYEEYKKGLLKAATEAGVSHPADKAEDVGAPLPQSVNQFDMSSIKFAPGVLVEPSTSDSVLTNPVSWQSTPIKFKKDYFTKIDPRFKFTPTIPLLSNDNGSAPISDNDSLESIGTDNPLQSTMPGFKSDIFPNSLFPSQPQTRNIPPLTPASGDSLEDAGEDSGDKPQAANPPKKSDKPS